MTKRQYFAFCSRVGVTPLLVNPRLWQLALSLAGLLHVGLLCMLLGIAFYVPHGWMLLAVFGTGATSFWLFTHCLRLSREP